MNRRSHWLDISTGILLAALALTLTPLAMTGGLSNQQRFEQLGSEELSEIKNQKRRYDAMPEPKQQRLRQLHEQLAGHPDRDALMATMRAYYDWLGKLESNSRRARLKSLETVERVEEVRSIRLRQAEQFFGYELPRGDVQKLFGWTAEFVKQNDEQIEKLFNERMDESERGNRSAARRQWMARRPDIQFLVLYNFHPEQALSLIDNDDLNQLKSSLSSEANQKLDEQPDDTARKRLVYRWVVSAIEAQRRPPPWDLRNFYEIEMSAEQKERVDNMDRQQREREIIRLYNRSRDRAQFGIPGERRRSGRGRESSRDQGPEDDEAKDRQNEPRGA